MDDFICQKSKDNNKECENNPPEGIPENTDTHKLPQGLWEYFQDI
jgi:hypothetical protein